MGSQSKTLKLPGHTQLFVVEVSQYALDQAGIEKQHFRAAEQ